MNASDYDTLLRTIYAAAVEPELWPSLIEGLSDAIGGGGGALIEQNQADGTGEAVVVRLDDAASDVYFGFETRNVLLRVDNPHDFMRTWTPRILTDEDWMPKEDLVRSEYYDVFLHPRDMHSIMMVRLARWGLDTAHISIGRSRRHGSYSACDLEMAQRLHSHLIHAFTLGQKVGLMRGFGETLAQVLDGSPYGVLFLDKAGKVGFVNRKAERMMRGSGVIGVSGGRLHASGAHANSKLQSLIASAAGGRTDLAVGGSMAIKRPSRALPLSVTVSPVEHRRFATLGAAPAAIVCITDPHDEVSPPAERLIEMYGLTPGEARVALALFEGHSVKEAAVVLGLSVHTVRIHLVHVFAKTQTNRQAELVILMMRGLGLDFE